MLYFRKAEGARISNMTFLSCEKYNDKDKYTDKDKYKDKYKDKVKVHKILNMCYIFEKQRVQGYQI